MELTNEYILECLNKYCDFDGTLHKVNFEEKVVAPLNDAECFHLWDYASGVTKGVLIFKDFVIKIPFDGEVGYGEERLWYEDEDGNEHCYTSAHHTDGYTRTNMEHHYSDAEIYFTDFTGAEFREESGCWDYCAVEVCLYEEAKKAGVEKFFAKTECIGYVGNLDHPIYKQELCKTYDDNYYSNRSYYNNRTNKDYDKVSSIRSTIDFQDANDNWVLDAALYFGEELMAKFAQFCFDWSIEDLHDGNIGYIDSRPCLIDYSSYSH